jgi:group I intron endonuclease
MPKSVIYKIITPTGREYIGKTIDFKNRMSSYRRLNNVSQKAIHNSILKYGWDNHKVLILQEAPKEELNALEIKYIKEHNTYIKNNPLGLNLTIGGEGALGRIVSEETKIKMIKVHLGSKRSDYTKKLMSEIKKGKIPYASKLSRSEKQLHHIKYGNLGRKRKPESIKKEMETKLKNFLNKKGACLQYSFEGVLLKEWKMIPKDVSKIIGIDNSYLLKALKTPGKSAKGFYWKYKIKQK